MGMPGDHLLKLIRNSGSLNTIPFANASRTKLIWSPGDNRDYKAIEFRLSPLGRLFMMRFTLRDDLRRESAALRKKFIERFLGPTLDPRRFQVEGSDMILYLPVDQARANFFDVTDLKTGDKIFEIFDGGVDSLDAQEARKAAEQAGAQKSGNAQGNRDAAAPPPSAAGPSEAPAASVK
jgi:hypothetical protein